MLKSNFTHRDILELWKGPRYLSEMAKQIGVPKHRCRIWKQQDNIPPQYWPQLIHAVRQAFEVELTTDQLTNAVIRTVAVKEKIKQVECQHDRVV